MQTTEELAVYFATHFSELFILMNAGFFDMRNGSMTVHFDNAGKIRKIEKHNVFTVT